MYLKTSKWKCLLYFICIATSENDYSNLHIQHFPNLRSAGEVGKIKGEELATPPNSAWRQKNSANLMRSNLFSGRVATFLTTQPTIRVTMLNFGDSANLFLLCQLNSTLSFLFYDSVNIFPYNIFILKAFFATTIAVKIIAQLYCLEMSLKIHVNAFCTH